MMLLQRLAIAAAGLSVAAAFLVPPEMTHADADAAAGSVLPFGVPTTSESVSINVQCPGCPLVLRDRQGKLRLKEDVPNHLVLNFTIGHAVTHDHLQLNGVQIFPHPPMTQLSAPQVPEGREEMDPRHSARRIRFLEAAPVDLGSQLEIRQVAVDPEDSQMELFVGRLQIVQVGKAFVDNIPEIEIKFIRSPHHALMIGGVRATEPRKVPFLQAPPADCDTILCKWRAIVAEQLQRVKGHKCAKGRMGHHFKGEHHHREGDHGGHSRHHHDGHPKIEVVRLHEHSWGQLFKSFRSHILFPVLVGIAAGVSVSIVGMMICTVFVGLWRFFVRGQPFFHQRRRHGGHSHHRAAQREAAFAAEKSGLMADQGVPPAYRDDESKTDA